MEPIPKFKSISNGLQEVISSPDGCASAPVISDMDIVPTLASTVKCKCLKYNVQVKLALNFL